MTFPRGELSVDLNAVVANWQYMRALTAEGVETAAVVKANAYGLGAVKITGALLRAGCRKFFVANLAEALEIADIHTHSAKVSKSDISIYVFSGCAPGEEKSFSEHNFIPVLISLEMLQRWRRFCHTSNKALPSALKLDTGMSRLGLESKQLDQIIGSQPQAFQEAGVALFMSHFACADEPTHPMNTQQLKRFAEAFDRLKCIVPEMKASLANSAGVLLSPKTHYHVTRPGIFLYGGQAQKDSQHLPQNCVALTCPIIQVRQLAAGAHIGYGATKQVDSERTLAVVSGGYADGIFRSLSNLGYGYLHGVRVDIVGRISMDLTIFDVTHIAHKVRVNDQIELLGQNISIDQLAEAADTISYEILTSLGSRYHRRYIGDSVE